MSVLFLPTVSAYYTKAVQYSYSLNINITITVTVMIITLQLLLEYLAEVDGIIKPK